MNFLFQNNNGQNTFFDGTKEPTNEFASDDGMLHKGDILTIIFTGPATGFKVNITSFKFCIPMPSTPTTYQPTPTGTPFTTYVTPTTYPTQTMTPTPTPTTPTTKYTSEFLWAKLYLMKYVFTIIYHLVCLGHLSVTCSWDILYSAT